ncbi:permease-like cell division protein FtsX [Numidum massiliense]|uniref:permease-like cell division protein FtsX n=1 Tax=Numidum massiliense TaxID=1522315 RepID=UPI0006D59DEE|nr:permease-like cell division protein FtsX [Numidum massiliense]
MRIDVGFRHIREGAKSFVRNGWMSVAAAGAVSVTLLILGVVLLLAMNVNYIVNSVENQVQVRVMLDLETKEAQAKTIESEMLAIPGVKHVEFVSKEEALEQLKTDMGDAKLLEGMEGKNPLPHAFIVKTSEPEQVEAVAKKIKVIDGVNKAEYGADYTGTLFSTTSVLRTVGIVFIVLLGVASVFLISNTIRLTILARRREIEIMKLVGATNWFIRWPFFIEGLFIGLIGAIIPTILLLIGYYNVSVDVMKSLQIPFLKLLPMYPTAYQVTGLLLAIGAFIGAAGSFLSMRRFLKI